MLVEVRMRRLGLLKGEALVRVGRIFDLRHGWPHNATFLGAERAWYCIRIIKGSTGIASKPFTRSIIQSIAGQMDRQITGLKGFKVVKPYLTVDEYTLLFIVRIVADNTDVFFLKLSLLLLNLINI